MQTLDNKPSPLNKRKLFLSFIASFCLSSSMIGMIHNEFYAEKAPTISTTYKAVDYNVYLNNTPDSPSQILEIPIPFIQSVIEKTYNYNYKNYDSRTVNSKNLFTQDGIERFKDYLNHTHIQSYIIKNKLIVKAVADENLEDATLKQIVSDGANTKYKIDIPVTMFYITENGKIFTAFNSTISMTLIKNEKTKTFLVDDLNMHG